MTEEKKGRSQQDRRHQQAKERMRFHRTLLDVLFANGESIDRILKRIRRLCPQVDQDLWEQRLLEIPPTDKKEIARFLQSLGVIQQLPRKVRLKRVLGKMDAKFPVGTEKVGWEIEWPESGKSYCLYMEDGRVFRTGKIEEFDVDHFRTGNSVYAIESAE